MADPTTSPPDPAMSHNYNQNHQTVIVAGPPPSQALPALVNFMCFPGLGQLIQGRVVAALVWWCLHILAALSCFFLVGFVIWPIVWIGCVIDAAWYNPYAHNREPAGLGTVVLVGVIGALICIPVFLLAGGAAVAMISGTDPPTTVAESPTPVAMQPAVLPVETPASTGIQLDPVEPPATGPATVEHTQPTAAELVAKKAEEDRLAAEAKAEAERLLTLQKSRDQLIDEAKWRTWRAREGGFSVEAKFISFGGGKVKLEKRDGKVIDVPVDILVEVDAAFIREQRWLKAAGQ